MQQNLPKFENEDDEREFWAHHDSVDYLQWEDSERIVLPKLKRSPMIEGT
jgi:sucrose-6-phosphate hydrolase SacC (GH32 family)